MGMPLDDWHAAIVLGPADVAAAARVIAAHVTAWTSQGAYTVGFAVATCAECPVRAECLADAERNGDEHGIRGGLLPAQRRTRPIHHGTRGGARTHRKRGQQ